MSRRACVTGIGLITPIGNDPATFWEALLRGRSGAAPVRSFDTSELPCHQGCEVDEGALSPRAEGLDLGGRCTALALESVRCALEDAGLTGSAGQGAGSLTAVVVGTTMGEVTRFEQDRAAHAEREPDVEDVRSLIERPLDVMGRAVAAAYGLTGPVITAPAACAAGSYAVGLAAELVRRGEVARAVAVGCEAFSRLAFVGFARLRAMSADCCRPFSLNRPGLLLGEGAGALVLESSDGAAERGRAPLGFVDGFGLSCDAHHVTAPDPRGTGAARAMVDALRRAGLTAADVDYVNAHGTGTPHNDRMECAALQAVFGDRLSELPVSSIKALTGHMLGAAGAVEAIAVLLALRHGVIPPTWNWVEADPACPVDCVPNAPRPGRLRRALSNSYAFGGNNASLLLTASGPGAG